MRHLLQWLYPGLAVKRWMLLFSLGILLLVFGATLILNYQIFGILEEEMLRFAFQMTGSYSYTFLAVCGTLMASSVSVPRSPSIWQGSRSVLIFE